MSLRVTFVLASHGIGGAERSMLRLMALAHRRTWDCRVILSRQSNDAFRRSIEQIDVPCHTLSPWDVPGWLRHFHTHRPDVLYVFGRFRTIPWAVLGRLAGVRCIVAAERSAANRGSDRLARFLDRRVVTAYIANSEFGAANLRSFVGRRRPVWVVPNGIVIHTPARRADPHGPPRLICVGNITANKGQLVLLQAVEHLRIRHPGVRAILVGRDFTGGRFFEEAKSQGLTDTFTAVGFAEDVAPYWAQATLAVLPTLKREGMPSSLLEAMAVGVPVVASGVGGVGEIIEDGKTGLLVRPGDAVALARAIDRLLDDPDERRRLAGNARESITNRYDLSAMLEGHREAFRSALALASDRRAHSSHGLDSPSTVAHVTTVAASLRYLLLGQLLAVRDGGHAVVGISAPGADGAALHAARIPHFGVPMTRRLTPFADALSLWRLYRLMRAQRFTIVHAHNPKPGLLAQWAARLARVPVVVNTVHGFYFHDRTKPLARGFYVALEKIAALCSDVILFQNEEDVETAIRLGITRREKVRHLGNGIDLERFDPGRLLPGTREQVRRSLAIESGALVVGFVGRLVDEKGVKDLLLAARRVLESHPLARFLFVGSPDLEKPDPITEDAALALGIQEACRFTGTREDLPEIYAAMDIFVLPSYREGLPRAAMEASAMELPSVVTDVRGCRQVVADGRNGLLVPPGDPISLAAAIETLLADPILRQRFGEEGRRRAVREFDEKRVFARVLDEYERLLKGKGLGSPLATRPVIPLLRKEAQ